MANIRTGRPDRGHKRTTDINPFQFLILIKKGEQIIWDISKNTTIKQATVVEP